MATNPIQAMLQQASEPDPELQKAAKNVMTALGDMYRVCHRIDPSGQACQAISQIMTATSEVANTAEQLGQQGPPPPSNPFDAAAQNVGAAMQAGPMEQAMPPEGTMPPGF